MPANKNASLLRALETQADALSCSAAKNEFPVLLRPIAERRKVTAVEFRPLLVDAMLTTHARGFRILFNSGGKDSSELQEKYEHETRENLLPPRLRFSLAHEIAHTLFYDLSNGTPQVVKEFRSGGKRTALENLERSCNKLAAQLLLPTPMLKTALRNKTGIDPESLLEIARQAGVSVEVLVHRLAEMNALLLNSYFRGCVVFVKRLGAELIIGAVAKPKPLNIARELLLMRTGERWQLVSHDGARVYPDELNPVSTVTLTVETQHSTVPQRYKTRVAEFQRSGPNVSYLITFEEVSER